MKVTHVLKMSVASIGAMSLIACTGSNKNRSEFRTIDTNSIVTNPKMSAATKAETLARSAEEMLISNPAGFFYANEIVSLALTMDRQNQRAQFYKSLLAPAMTTKGILTRILPLVDKTQDAKARYLADKENMKNTLPDSLYAFLTQGPQDIQNEKHVQKYIDSVIQSYDALRLFHKNNKNSELTLHLPQTLALNVLSEKMGQKECEVKKLSDNTYEFRLCTKDELVSIKLSKGDHEAIQQIAAGLQVYTIALNMRDLTGAIRTAETYKGLHPSLKHIYSSLAQEKDFSVVRDLATSQKVLALGLDGVAGVKYVMSAQNELCPDKITKHRQVIDEDGDGQDDRDSNGDGWDDSCDTSYYDGNYEECDLYNSDKYFDLRPGYAFSNGLCLKNKDNKGRPVDDVLNTVHLVLKGGAYEFKSFNLVDKAEKSYEVKPAQFFSKPIADLKTLKPQFDECEANIIGIQDGTLGGVFTKGSANDFLKESDCALNPPSHPDEELPDEE